jgi:GNAT superfamily N-acetyltransferase
VGYAPPEPLAAAHELADFACGEPALDEWLRRHARASHAGGTARVFVTTHSDDPTRVVGYYALAAGQVEAPDATPRVLKGQPTRRAVPVALLARLAVDRDHQGQRVGRSLLRDAMLRVLGASDPIGIRALVVHAKHARTRAWYLRYGFEPSPTDPLHLLLLLKDAKRVLDRDAP